MRLADQIIEMALKNRGLKRYEIAKLVGCDPAHVTRALLSNGFPRISRNKPITVDRKRMRELYDAGCCDVEIGRQLGCYPSTVMNWRRYEKLPSIENAPNRDIEKAALVAARLKEGKTFSQIARELGTTRNAVAGYAYRVKKWAAEEAVT